MVVPANATIPDPSANHARALAHYGGLLTEARQIAALLDRVEHLEATVKELQRALSVQRNRLDHVEMRAA